MLLLSAVLIGAIVLVATRGRETLGALAPAGIIMLNVAVNMAPGWGPLPVSASWLLYYIPIPYGPTRVALNLLILYWPSLFAIALMSYGPPGRPMLRLLLGLWVAYVGIATIFGPARQMFSDFQVSDPASWLEAGAMVFAGGRFLIIALNVAALYLARDRGSAQTIARIVHVDSMGPLAGIAIGVAFWGAVRLLYMLELSRDTKMALVLAAPFILGGFLAKRGATGDETVPDEALVRASGWMPSATIMLFFAAIFVGAGIFVWREIDSDREGYRPVLINPVTGTAIDTSEWDRRLADASYTISDFDPLIQQRLRLDLEAAGVPFEVETKDGSEVLRVKYRDRQAVERVQKNITGPPLPVGQFREVANDTEREAFQAWLASKGLPSFVVHNRNRTSVTWGSGTRRMDLDKAYDRTRRAHLAGVDFFPMHTAEIGPADGVTRDTIAAFDGPQARARFEAWLKKRHIEPREVTIGRYSFVAWDSPKGVSPLDTYVEELKAACRAQIDKRARPDRGPVDYSAC